jgi:hypothetical protein
MMCPIEMMSRGHMEHSVIDWHTASVGDKPPRLKQETATRLHNFSQKTRIRSHYKLTSQSKPQEILSAP